MKIRRREDLEETQQASFDTKGSLVGFFEMNNTQKEEGEKE
jgi:hypothetical protein